MSVASNDWRKAMACALALAFCGATASAGEITGNGKSLKTGEHSVQGKSICAFSGLNDEYILGDEEANHTQSWGQIPKWLKEVLTLIGESPGVACNPSKQASN